LFFCSFLALLMAPRAFAAEPAPEKSVELNTAKTEVAKKEATGDVVKTGDILTEHVLGNATAPVTVIEYASLNCSHCAHFHKEVLPEVVKKYVATGKIKILFRDFPLNGIALKAAQLTQCMPEDRYFPFVKTLFENQDAWSGAQDPEATLTQYAKLAGLPGERVTKCLNDKDIQDAIVKRRMQAENQFKVSATPTFVVNYGQDSFTGIGTIADFDKAIAKFIKK
ncbi:MAG: DsbA family protein, partial [Alphaproteobacteria bacterium]|nr:DsbA family protein [Alphaproteobacteria bacterium]